MDAVRSPQQAHFMAHAVVPVVAQVVQDQSGQPGPYAFHRPMGQCPEVVDPSINAQCDQFSEQAADLAEHPHIEAANRVRQTVDLSVLPVRDPSFDAYAQQKYRDGQEDRVHDKPIVKATV